ACVDACHAAVEFEEPEQALADAVRGGASLGKLQYTSALALREPARHPAGREQLFALDEPRFLHQVTARGAHGLVRAGDLGEARAAFERGDAAWRDADEWRCHFHVPTDLASGGADGLGTTRAHAEALLAAAVGSPELWGTAELHLEIETYTWSILPRAARGDGELVDGLEREYRHVLGCLGRLGWTA
ncbi:MAG: xylose isomerase, partial [Planctomycetes bacterium]|nr:xylose isomerase [Planctomycetota bacterium]